MNFETQIQQWVSVDNQLKKAYEQVKELREKRNSLTNSIITHASNNNMTDATIKISDGRLKFTNTRVAEPLTYKYLETNLGDIIKNPDQVRSIIQLLKQKRSIKVEPEIKRFTNN
jgi:Family of unknown function (DUF5760)